MDKINRIRENIGSVMIGMEEVTDLRPYRDIRGMTADWIMQLEEMASSETDPFNSPIIPEELRELGGNHPTPVLLIYLGWLLTGAVLLFTLILIIRLVIEYIHQFQEKKTEENGDIAVSLEEDAAVRVRRFVSSRRAGRNLTEREKIRQEYMGNQLKTAHHRDNVYSSALARIRNVNFCSFPSCSIRNRNPVVSDTLRIECFLIRSRIGSSCSLSMCSRSRSTTSPVTYLPAGQ